MENQSFQGNIAGWPQLRVQMRGKYVDLFIGAPYILKNTVMVDVEVLVTPKKLLQR